MNDVNSLKQIDGLWFSDDTLILRAEDSIFRVTKSILAARSPVFQALFEFPQPTTDEDEDDVMDGRPLIRLHDSAGGISPSNFLFEVIFFMPPPATASLHEALGILRLAHKYDVAYLYDSIVLDTGRGYTRGLVPEGMHGYGDVHSRYHDYVHGNVALHFKAITVFHEVGASWLLPYAYYRIGTCTFDEYLATGEAWTQLPVDIQHRCIRLYALHVRGTARINSR
ncbi:hypothetical protein C8R47DRAFT_1224623 [Mycena vitilis]|nr:hypothetical protein C8R47DRAFT_1224623 [Mycena vitilis]